MSLQLWLPLNGNLNNQGLANTTITSNNLTFTDGKMGTAATFNSSHILLENPPLNYTPEFSIAFWYKTSSPTSTAALYNGRNETGKGIAIFNLSSGYFRFDDDILTTFSTYSIPANTWIHCCFTRSLTRKMLYINGVCRGGRDSSSKLNVDVTYASIGRSSTNTNSPSGNAINGQLNDFRIYDHCLSAKEVKEISKGLVLHYPLKGVGQENLVKDGDLINKTVLGSAARGNCNNVTSLTATDDGLHLITPSTGNQNNGIVFKYVNGNTTLGLTYGDTITYSVDLKGTAGFNAKIKIISNYTTDNGTWWYATGYSDKATVISDINNNTWKRYSVTFTLPPNDGGAYFTIGFSINGSYSSDIYIKNIKVEKGSIATPWLPNPADTLYTKLGYDSNIEFDRSGFNNNGTISGTLKADSNTPRYNTSYNFVNGTDYIKSQFTKSMSELSCSFWVKPVSSNGGYAIVASNYNSPSSGFWITTNTEGSGVWFYSNGSYVRNNSGATLTNGEWRHCVFTFKDGVAKWYLSGSLARTTDISSSRTSLNITNLTVGNSYTGTSWNTKQYGNISDFRLYATCLSYNDVKELYEVGTAIDNTNNIHAYEYIE